MLATADVVIAAFFYALTAAKSDIASLHLLLEEMLAADGAASIMLNQVLTVVAAALMHAAVKREIDAFSVSMFLKHRLQLLLCN